MGKVLKGSIPIQCSSKGSDSSIFDPFIIWVSARPIGASFFLNSSSRVGHRAPVLPDGFSKPTRYSMCSGSFLAFEPYRCLLINRVLLGVINSDNKDSSSSSMGVNGSFPPFNPGTKKILSPLPGYHLSSPQPVHFPIQPAFISGVDLHGSQIKATPPRIVLKRKVSECILGVPNKVQDYVK